MINRTDIEKLIHNARQNRGFWIGFFADGISPNVLSTVWPDRPHVTACHLGRQVSDETVENVCAALDAHGSHIVVGEVTGCGYFWRVKEPTIVALVNSAAMFTARTQIMKKLADHHVPLDERFGFIPHITLAQKDENGPATADVIFKSIREKSFKLNFKLGVCCGDDVVYV